MFLCFLLMFWWAMWKYVTGSRNAKHSLDNLHRNMLLLGFIFHAQCKQYIMYSKYQNCSFFCTYIIHILGLINDQSSYLKNIISRRSFLVKSNILYKIFFMVSKKLYSIEMYIYLVNYFKIKKNKIIINITSVLLPAKTNYEVILLYCGKKWNDQSSTHIPNIMQWKIGQDV